MPILLDDWSVTIIDDDPYLPPERRPSTLHGKVYGHPRFENGKCVFTSKPVAYRPDDRLFKTYSGSVYKLGKINQEYLEQFPDADSRLTEQLAQLPLFDVEC